MASITAAKATKQTQKMTQKVPADCNRYPYSAQSPALRPSRDNRFSGLGSAATTDGSSVACGLGCCVMAELLPSSSPLPSELSGGDDSSERCRCSSVTDPSLRIWKFISADSKNSTADVLLVQVKQIYWTPYAHRFVDMKTVQFHRRVSPWDPKRLWYTNSAVSGSMALKASSMTMISSCAYTARAILCNLSAIVNDVHQSLGLVRDAAFDLHLDCIHHFLSLSPRRWIAPRCRCQARMPQSPRGTTKGQDQAHL